MSCIHMSQRSAVGYPLVLSDTYSFNLNVRPVDLTIRLSQQEYTVSESSGVVLIDYVVIRPDGELTPFPLNMTISFRDISATGGNTNDNSMKIMVKILLFSVAGTDYDNSTIIVYSSMVEPLVVNTLNLTIIYNDDYVESTEEFSISLDIQARVSPSSITTATVVVMDDDSK